jgi:hypothetical protein
MNYQSIAKDIADKALSLNYGSVIQLTSKFDHMFAPTDLSRWMDTVNGHAGGWFHRVQHGHDFFSNVGDVFEKFGAKGVAQYPFELLKDLTTAHGLEFPRKRVQFSKHFC